MGKRILADGLLVLLATVAILAAAHNHAASVDQQVSYVVYRTLHQHIVLCWISGAACVVLVLLIQKLWDIKLRYIIAILGLGMFFGHILWSLPTR